MKPNGSIIKPYSRSKIELPKATWKVSSRMNDGWQLRVYDGGKVYVADLAGSAEIGR